MLDNTVHNKPHTESERDIAVKNEDMLKLYKQAVGMEIRITSGEYITVPAPALLFHALGCGWPFLPVIVLGGYLTWSHAATR